jgi:hypothetical protein
MEIQFEITSHCIQTEARKRYEQFISTYFKQAASDNDTDALEGQIEALRYFLEHADFRYLRSTYPILNGGQGGTIVVLSVTDSLKEMKLVHDEEVIDITK